MRPFTAFCICCWIGILSPGRILLGAAPDSQGVEFFEQRIRPVLAGECYECHAGDKSKGGLRLDSRARWEQGGDSGPAIVPRDPAGSLLLKAIRHLDPDLAMPKNRPPLSERIVRDFHRWIEMGAPDPRETPDSPETSLAQSWRSIREERRQWWSLQPIAKPSRPRIGDLRGDPHPVDAFLAAEWSARGLSPADPADRRTLVRRLSFVLTGLPPDAGLIREFLGDSRPDAYLRIVDRLLASPAFGEHWARKWMDWVRYAETHGSEGDPEIRGAWHYRDYLIRAFNRDVPWNQLIREHLAGDLLESPRFSPDGRINESRIGPAHLRLVEHGFQPIDTEEDQVRVIENQIDVLGKAFQGLTLACARCHNHKFDAVSQRDYYALYGIFASLRPAMVPIDAPAAAQGIEQKLLTLKSRIRGALADQWHSEAGEIPAKLRDTRLIDEQIRRIEDQIHGVRARLMALQQEALQAMAQSNSDGSSTMQSLIGRWTFDAGPEDEIRGLKGALHGNAQIRDGRLVLDGQNAHLQTEALGIDLAEKTLEAWVRVDPLSQRGGGVITVESSSGEIFDSITYAEREPGRWMAGSDFGRRTEALAGGRENDSRNWIHMAITYHAGGQITVYRNGRLYGSPYARRDPPGSSPVSFESSARVLFGRRHTGGANAFFRGEIEEGRLYARALTAEEIAGNFAAGPDGVSQQFSRVLPPEKAGEWTALKARLQAWEGERAALRSKQETTAKWQTAIDRVRTASAGSGPEAESSPEPGSFGRAGTSWAVSLEGPGGWFAHGTAATGQPGEFAIETRGPALLNRILHQGVASHGLSQKQPALLTSPRFKIETDYISVLAAGGNGAAIRLIPNNYPLGINSTFPKIALNHAEPRWIRLDTAYRKGDWAHLEVVTANDLVRGDGRPPADGRSWFEIQAVHFHNSGAAPEGTPSWMRSVLSKTAGSEVEPLLDPVRVRRLVRDWAAGTLTPEGAGHLEFLLRHRFLSNEARSDGLKMLLAEYRAAEEALPVPVRVPGVVEAVAFNAPFMRRGDHKNPGDEVPRGYLEVFGAKTFPGDRSGRLQLAEQMVSPDNPLTPRVLVNRIWLHLFGEGLVRTPDNFGRLGELPSHPALLDFLASRFVDEEWSLKKMIRFLVASSAFQASSTPSHSSREIDPDNRWFSHYRVHRLPAEAIRDQLLWVSGQLDATLFGPPATETSSRRRSVYMAVRRTDLNPFLQIFDAPKPFSTLGRRDVTVVPAQSLALLNDPFVIRSASAWARSLIAAQGPGSPSLLRDRAARMFEAALGRPLRDHELQAALEYLEQSTSEGEGQAGLDEEALWTRFAQSLFNLKEFIYVR